MKTKSLQKLCRFCSSLSVRRRTVYNRPVQGETGKELNSDVENGVTLITRYLQQGDQKNQEAQQTTLKIIEGIMSNKQR